MKRHLKFTKLEKSWILYDVGNSAFTLLISTIIPIYFKSMTDAAGIAASDSTALWSYAASVCTVIVAILGPIFGTLADTKGFKKPLFVLRPFFLFQIITIYHKGDFLWTVFLVRRGYGT